MPLLLASVLLVTVVASPVVASPVAASPVAASPVAASPVKAATAQQSVTGRILNTLTQLPLSGVTVENLGYPASTVTGADGTFLLPAIAGTNTIRATRDGYVQGSYGAVVASEGSVDITLALLPVRQYFTTIPRPYITGDARVGMPLEAHIEDHVPQADRLSYQWFADTQVIFGQFSPVYYPTADTLGRSISVMVTATIIHGDEYYFTDPTSALTSPGTPRVQAAAVVPASPSVSGVRAVGQALAAVPGQWSPSDVTFAYQWYRNGVPIAGAIGPSYTQAAADLGALVTVVVSGRSGTLDAVSRTARQFFRTAPGSFTMAAPALSSTSTVGTPITVGWSVPEGTPPISPAPPTLGYRWTADGTTIAGATGATYTPAPADLGREIVVIITASGPGFESASQTASAGITAPGSLVAGTPSTGAARVGSTVTASTGSWLPAPASFAYQWNRSGVPIAGATSSSYVPAAGDLGGGLTVTVSGSRTGYSSAAATSAPVTVGPGILASTVRPTVTGASVVGSTLSASPGGWSPAASAVTYQWRVGGSPVQGATGSSFSLSPFHVDAPVSVTVTATRPGYAESAITVTFSSVVTGRIYPNCAALNADYPHGVMQPGARDLRSGTLHAPYAGTFVSQSLYNLNAAGRDADKDGIACEKQ